MIRDDGTPNSLTLLISTMDAQSKPAPSAASSSSTTALSLHLTAVRRQMGNYIVLSPRNLTCPNYHHFRTVERCHARQQLRPVDVLAHDVGQIAQVQRLVLDVRSRALRQHVQRFVQRLYVVSRKFHSGETKCVHLRRDQKIQCENGTSMTFRLGFWLT